ncbi:MAG: hypothetical protein ACREDR_28765, partial [Blastocatellia bacterium]
AASEELHGQSQEMTSMVCTFHLRSTAHSARQVQAPTSRTNGQARHGTAPKSAVTEVRASRPNGEIKGFRSDPRPLVSFEDEDQAAFRDSYKH